MLRSGHRAPDFKLARLGGGTATLSDLVAGGRALLAFFKTTCPVCQLTFPFLERLNRGPASNPIAVYAISQDDPESTLEFNSRFGITFPTLLDTEESGYPASNAYGISHVPSLFLVERDGAIAWSMEGFNKRELQAVAAQAGVKLFHPGEQVPAWKAG